MHRKYTTWSRGVTALEVVFGVAIASLVLVFVSQTVVLFVNAERDMAERTKAIYYGEEGIELLRYLRDGSWSTIGGLAQNTTYYLAVTPTSIGITTTATSTDGYTRSFRVQPIYRDNTSKDIVASTTAGSSADSNGRYIFMNVTWGNATSSVALTSALLNINQ